MEDSSITSVLQWMNASFDKVSSAKQCFISPKIETKVFDVEGRGLGAKSSIYSNEEIIKIPHTFLLNTHSIIRHISTYNPSIKLPSSYGNVDTLESGKTDEITKIYSNIQLDEMTRLSSFQLMTFYLCLETHRDSFWKPFIDSLPGMETFAMTPLVWEIMKIPNHKEYLDLLPSSTRTHAKKVYDRFSKDKKRVEAFLREKLEIIHSRNRSEELCKKLLDQELYLWAWMCVNSRCLYMELEEGKDTADNFTMAPFVDMVNHTDEDHCKLVIDNKGFHVITTTNYKMEDQIFLSYGPHSNEFLLCEYGFTMANNKWNDIDISEPILEEMNSDQIEFLKKSGYYGDYTIGKSGVSYRTEIALAVLQESQPETSRRLSAYVKGLTAGESFERGSKRLLGEFLRYKLMEINKHKYLDEENGVYKVIGRLYRDMKDVVDVIE